MGSGREPPVHGEVISENRNGGESLKPIIIFTIFFTLVASLCLCRGVLAQNSDVIDILEKGGDQARILNDAIKTYDGDGRKSIVALYRAQLELKNKYGWELERVFSEDVTLANGSKASFPATCLKTPQKGTALWIIAGIHGEEPAGPVALSQNLRVFQSLKEKGIPIVIFPLCNPSGYYRNWRYHNVIEASRDVPGESVSDSEHLLLDDTGKPRRNSPASPICDAFTKKVIELAAEYPPVLAVDFHEDCLKTGGYLYSQGVMGAGDPVARKIIREFIANDFPLCLTDETELDEIICDGIISSVKDGSVDELLSAGEIFCNGSTSKGPRGRTVIVIETGSKGIPLSLRVKIQSHFMRMLPEFWKMAYSEGWN